MKKRYIILSIFTALLIGGGAYLYTPDTDRDEMIAKYGAAPSAFTPPRADGLSVHYRDQGCRECPALVLLHGSNASLHTWEGMVEALSDRYRLISYDHQGHGLTGPHPGDDYSAEAFIEVLNHVVDTLGVERFSLAGNSMGGWISWRYAVAHPERLEGLVLLDASGAPLPPGAQEPPLSLGFRILMSPFGRALSQWVTPRSLIEASLYDTVSVDSMVTEETIDLYWELGRFPGNRRATAQRFAFYSARNGDEDAAISDVTIPTLIIWGAEDTIILVRDADTFHQEIKDSELIIYDEVGHLPMEEIPARVAQDIDAFLQRRVYAIAPNLEEAAPDEMVVDEVASDEMAEGAQAVTP